MGAILGEKEASRASAVAVLQALHAHHAIEELPIDVLTSEEGREAVHVVAVGPAAESGVVLAPCVPKRSQVVETASHPHAVRIVVKSTACAPDEASGEAPCVHEFAVVPEFKQPVEGKPTAVAEGHQESPIWVWADNAREAETMNPFWAVRRMTDEQLSKANAAKPMTQPKLRFNCNLVDKSFSAVCAGILQTKAIASTRMVEVQCLTNSVDLVDGEELALRVCTPVPKQKAGAKRTWMDASKDKRKEEEREEAKRARQAKAVDVGIAV